MQALANLRLEHRATLLLLGQHTDHGLKKGPLEQKWAFLVTQRYLLWSFLPFGSRICGLSWLTWALFWGTLVSAVEMGETFCFSSLLGVRVCCGQMVVLNAAWRPSTPTTIVGCHWPINSRISLFSFLCLPLLSFNRTPTQDLLFCYESPGFSLGTPVSLLPFLPVRGLNPGMNPNISSSRCANVGHAFLRLRIKMLTVTLLNCLHFKLACVLKLLRLFFHFILNFITNAKCH